MVRMVTRAFDVAVVSLAVACGPAAPAPTPTLEPTPTPAWVPATKVEHLAGIWHCPVWAGLLAYHQFDADGTIKRGVSLEQLQAEPQFYGRFWFEDGVFYEESSGCFPIGSYRTYLEIEGSQAVTLRFEVIDDWDPECKSRRQHRRYDFSRVDR